MSALVRLVWAGWQLPREEPDACPGFFLLTSAIQPVIFATIAFFMFKAGAREGTLLYVSLGAGLMGIWSATLFASGGAIQWQRWQGTLELSIAAPRAVPARAAADDARLGDDRPLLADRRRCSGAGSSSASRSTSRSRWSSCSRPGNRDRAGTAGLVMASTFILWRNANALSNLLEYPIWLVTGLLVPISLLPGWVSPLAWVLAPTWGVRAIRDSALGTASRSPRSACASRSGRPTRDRSVHRALLRDLARDRATLSLT